MTKSEALEELRKPAYDVELQKQDFEYVAKKLGWTKSEFEEILDLPVRSHKEFKSDNRYWRRYSRLTGVIKPLIRKFPIPLTKKNI
jgi:hypothetical protein